MQKTPTRAKSANPSTRSAASSSVKTLSTTPTNNKKRTADASEHLNATLQSLANAIGQKSSNAAADDLLANSLSLANQSTTSTAISNVTSSLQVTTTGMLANQQYYPLSLPPPDDKYSELPFPTQARCTKHSWSVEPLLWYCSTCKESICTICRMEGHENHETMSFEEITMPISRRLQALEKEVDERKKTLKSIDVPRLLDRLCSTVDSDVQYLDSRLVRRCDEIKQDVVGRASRMRNDIETEMHICEDYLRKVEETIDVLNCVNVGEEPSQHPLFIPLMQGHISCSHFMRAAAPVEQYSAPRIADSLRLLELPIHNTLEACRNFDWTRLSADSVPNMYPRS